MARYQTPVIEYLFNRLWDNERNVLTRDTVTFDDIQEGIEWYNTQHPEKTISTANAANFFKDILRTHNFEAHWPASVRERGFMGVQATGGRRSFTFVPIAEGQDFPGMHDAPDPPPTASQVIQSSVLPMEVRLLDHTSEAWLTQVVAKLHVVETHFSAHSSREIVHVDHLQMNLKQDRTEIDSLYLATEETGRDTVAKYLVTVEAKRRNERIILEQIAQQVGAAARLAAGRLSLAGVIPLAIKICGPSEIQIVEWESVDILVASQTTYETLQVAQNVRYQFRPPVLGVT